MNGLERFALEIEHPEELIRPVTGDFLLLFHFFGMFPSRVLKGADRPDITTNNYDFLDLKFQKEHMKTNKSLLMWSIDRQLRNTYHSEDAALSKIDNAIILIQQPGQLAEGVVFSSKPQDYLPIFEIASPVYIELRKDKKFTFKDFFNPA